MRRVEIHEPRPLGETVRHTALRAGVGGLLILHAAQRLEHVRIPNSLLQPHTWQLPYAWDLTVPVGLLIAVELLAGVGLVLGLFSRTSALAGSLLPALTMLAAVGGPALSWAQLEASVLLCGVCLFLAAAGGGDFSADHALRERARRLAIMRDEIWSRPPYVPLNE